MSSQAKVLDNYLLFWLNPIEPRWVHAKRAVYEPDGELTSPELRRRLCAHFETQPLLNSFMF